MNSIYTAVLVVGNRIIINRTPVYIAELARRSGKILVLQKSFFKQPVNSANRFIKHLDKLMGAALYHILFPFLVMRSSFVFLPASNNYDAFYVRFWTKLFRRPLLVDYYVSAFEWESLLMNRCRPESLRAWMLRRSDLAAYKSDFIMHFNFAEIKHISEILKVKDRSREVFRCPLFTRFDKYVKKINPLMPKDHTAFVWWGSLLPLHGLDLIVRAFGKISWVRTDFTLHLCFMSQDKLNDFINNYEFSDKKWLELHSDLLLRDGSLPRFVNDHAHVGFSHFGTGDQAEYVGTNKVAEAMALGRTCLVSDAFSNSEIFGYPDAFFVCQRTIDSLAQAINTILDSPGEVFAKGLRCRALFEQHYSEEAGVNTFGKVLDEIESKLRNQ